MKLHNIIEKISNEILLNQINYKSFPQKKKKKKPINHMKSYKINLWEPKLEPLRWA